MKNKGLLLLLFSLAVLIGLGTYSQTVRANDQERILASWESNVLQQVNQTPVITVNITAVVPTTSKSTPASTPVASSGSYTPFVLIAVGVVLIIVVGLIVTSRRNVNPPPE